jgi:hypothetical protein
MAGANTVAEVGISASVEAAGRLQAPRPSRIKIAKLFTIINRIVVSPV